MIGGAGMTFHAQLVRAGVVLHCMDQLLFLLPHPGGYSSLTFTGLLFQCVPDERRRSAGRHLLEAFPPAPGERQRKGELVHSLRDKPPLNFIARGKSFRLRRSFSRGPPSPRGPLLLFLFWTVHGPFSRFLLEEKEKMGGAKHQPSSWLKSLPPTLEARQPFMERRIL